MTFILIGMVVDFLAMLLRIGDTFGYTKPRSLIGQGLPIGPFFYLFGIIGLFLSKEKSFLYCLIVLLCCFLYYIFIVNLPYIIYLFIVAYRRLKAKNNKAFRSNTSRGISPIDTIRQAIGLVTPNTQFENSKSGFVYLNSPNNPFRHTLIYLIRPHEIQIRIAECDPGHIINGYFARDMSSYGFSIKNWKIGKRKEIIVPPEDFDRIPEFMDVVFEKYYNFGKDYEIKAEVMLI